MAAVEVTILKPEWFTAEWLQRELRLTTTQITIGRLAELLHLPPDEAADWLICKVAQFRGASEADILAELQETP